METADNWLTVLKLVATSLGIIGIIYGAVKVFIIRGVSLKSVDRRITELEKQTSRAFDDNREALKAICTELKEDRQMARNEISRVHRRIERREDALRKELTQWMTTLHKLNEQLADLAIDKLSHAHRD